MLPVAPCHTNDIVLTLVSYIDVIGFALDFVISFGHVTLSMLGNKVGEPHLALCAGHCLTTYFRKGH